MTNETYKDLPLLEFANQRDWEKWLGVHGGTTEGAWIKLAKKDSGVTTTTYEEAREGAIVYGWIDGLINAYDDKYYLTRFTPRRPKGLWSKINRQIAEDLIAAGRMQPAGLATVEAARVDGRWEAAYDAPSTMEVPPDFQMALDANPKAKTFFETISKSNRYAVLYRVHTAHRPETRARRIETLIAMLEAKRTIH